MEGQAAVLCDLLARVIVFSCISRSSAVYFATAPGRLGLPALAAPTMKTGGAGAKYTWRVWLQVPATAPATINANGRAADGIEARLTLRALS